jgi:DNA-binding protein H-NS
MEVAMAKADATLETYLEGLDLAGLIDLREKLDGMIAQQAEGRRRELEAELEKLSSLTGGRRTAVAPTEKRTRGPAAPKYRSKQEPQQTWAGRGQRPKWLVEEMKDTGAALETFLIK